jgi:hypothetical protein
MTVVPALRLLVPLLVNVSVPDVPVKLVIEIEVLSTAAAVLA